jgi:hypothetical protein
MIDKSTWGPGPWQEESDVEYFSFKGIVCVLERGLFGIWCGYVRLPPTSAFSRDPDMFTHDGLDVHGGITFAQEHTFEFGDDEFKGYWLGFDCGHFYDYLPASQHIIQAGMLKGFPDLSKIYTETNRTYKDINFAREQVIGLAKQIINYDKNFKYKKKAKKNDR